MIYNTDKFWNELEAYILSIGYVKEGERLYSFYNTVRVMIEDSLYDNIIVAHVWLVNKVDETGDRFMSTCSFARTDNVIGSIISVLTCLAHMSDYIAERVIVDERYRGGDK